MKKTRLFKLLLTIFLIGINHGVFAQSNYLKPDKKIDSVWIEQSIINANKMVGDKDTNQDMHIWVNGKVTYSSDGLLRIKQLIALPNIFTTTIQYMSHGKIVEKNLDFSDNLNYSINSVYRLPDARPSYLFLLSEKEDKADYEQDWLKSFFTSSNELDINDYEFIKNLTYVAVVLRLEKDSLFEVSFPKDSIVNDQDTPFNNIDSAENESTSNTASLRFISVIKQSKKFFKPFLRYDTLAHTLSFLHVYCKNEDNNGNCDNPVLNVDSGAYKYKDTSFVLVNDTSYNFPSLSSLDTIVAHRNYKAGKYILEAKAIEGYEEDYGGYFYPTLTKEYKIGKQTLTAFNNDEWDKIDLKPDYSIQNSSSLLLLLTDITNGHGPGACGSGSHYDSYFWLADGKSFKQLFSFSTSTCNSLVSYNFIKNGKPVSGELYLIKPSEGNDSESGLDGSYWKNKSTYVFVISNYRKKISRNFYLRFNTLNKKKPVTLVTGKLHSK